MIVSSLIIVALAGCNPDRGVPKIAKYCPTLKTYSADKAKAVSTELKTHGALVPNTIDLIGDYGSLRRGIRATGCP